MIHVESVTAAVTTRLSTDPVLVSSAFRVQEGEALNRDLGLTPWVGLYYGNLVLAPGTLGGTQPWRAGLELFLYVQQGSHRSGQEATRLLSRAQRLVLDALVGDPTLSGTVLTLTALEITPFHRDVTENTWLFTNEIALKADLRG
ncbi:MAG: hypothetical protein OEW39_06285 [Deltaproteobacteria bacterium]|nr:hypothetical protein [Deltaproteobacteria bacterium]